MVCTVSAQLSAQGVAAGGAVEPACWPGLECRRNGCQALAERLLSSDPAAEEAHRALIRLHRHQGRMNAALRQFQLCKEALQRELGAEPEDETRALIADPRQVAFAADSGPSTPAAPPVAAETRPRELP